VQRLRPRLSHVHVYEWPTAEVRRPLAEGAKRWRAVFDCLAEPVADDLTEHRVAFLEFVEGDDTVALLRDAATLHDLLGEAT
jgi:hypothetical protein